MADSLYYAYNEYSLVTDPGPEGERLLQQYSGMDVDVYCSLWGKPAILRNGQFFILVKSGPPNPLPERLRILSQKSNNRP